MPKTTISDESLPPLFILCSIYLALLVSVITPSKINFRNFCFSEDTSQKGVDYDEIYDSQTDDATTEYRYVSTANTGHRKS